MRDLRLRRTPAAGRPGGFRGRCAHPTRGVHQAGRGWAGHAMRLDIPELSLVALIGASGSGKSPFARAHFRPTEVLSSDAFRAMVADDENDQAATADAFDSLYYVAGKRLRAGRLTVV